MSLGVGVTPTVAQPHVGTGVSQDEGEALVGQIDEEVVTDTSQTVLEEDNWSGI